MDNRRDVAKEICRNYNVVLSREALDAFASILVPIKVLRGHEIVKEGETCKCMYYVEKGLVLQYYKKGGETITEHISHEGDMVICIESFFTQQPSHIIATMLEPGIVYGIPHEEMRAIASRSYEVCCLIFAIEERSLIISQHKADSLRHETAKERYKRALRENPEMVRRSPLHHIASLLQMAPETLSRVRTQVMEEKN